MMFFSRGIRVGKRVIMKMTRHQVDGSKGNTGIMEQKGIVMVLGDFNGEVVKVSIPIYL